MIFPITSIKKYKNELYFSCKNTIYTEKSFIKAKNIIKDFKFFGENQMIIIGKNFIEIFEKNNKIKDVKVNELWILKNTLNFNDLICDVDENIILFHSGKMIDFLGNTIYKYNKSSIISGKIIKNKNIGFIIGTFDGIYYTENIEKEPEFLKLHKGRIFDCGLNNNKFYSCADDRKIIFGEFEIQESRNYFFKILVLENFIYSLNKDGYFRIFNIKEKSLKYSKYFGIGNLKSMFIEENDIYIGTIDGKLFNLKNEECKLIFGKMDFEQNLIFEEKVSIVCRNIKNDSMEFNLENNFLIIKTEFCNQKIDLKHFYSSINFADKNTIVLISKNLVTYIKTDDFAKNYNIKINNVSMVYKNYIGTSVGWLFTGEAAYKVSNSKITNILEFKDYLYVLDYSNTLFLIKKSEIFFNEKMNISKIITVKDVVQQDFLYKNYFSGINYNELVLKDFTCHLLMGEIKKGCILLGTNQGEIILKSNEIIFDFLRFNSEIVTIEKFSENFEYFVSTKNGIIYLVKIIDFKIFIKKKINLKYKIVNGVGNCVILSNGEIYWTDFKNYKRIILNNYCTAITKDLDKYFVGIDGKIYLLNFKDIELNNKINLKIESSEKEQNICVKKFYSKKIHTNNIYSIKVYKDQVYSVGDDHCLCKTNFDETKSIVAHSAQIVDFLCKEYIYTLSTDMRIGIFTLDLDLVRYININCQEPKFMFWDESGNMVVCGESVEIVRF